MKLLIIAVLALGILNEREEIPFSIETIAQDRSAGMADVPDSFSDLLSEPFVYLGHGTQSIAFFSKKDPRVVLKFFLTKGINGKKKYKVGSPLKLIPAYRSKKEKEKQERRERSLENVLRRYGSAYRELKEETGLIGIHLKSTESSWPLCRLIDKQGNESAIDLGRALFVIQKRASLSADVFSQSRTWEERAKALDAIEHLLEQRARKGYYDAKGGFLFTGNYGWVGESAILLDPGRIEYSEEIQKSPAAEIEKMKGRLKSALVEQKIIGS